MIASSIAAGVYDGADYNTTQNNMIDLLEPAGNTILTFDRTTLLIPHQGCRGEPTWRATLLPLTVPAEPSARTQLPATSGTSL